MAPIPTVTQVSAGGVAFHKAAGQIDVALIQVGPQMHWQLPKGTVHQDIEMLNFESEKNLVKTARARILGMDWDRETGPDQPDAQGEH